MGNPLIATLYSSDELWSAAVTNAGVSTVFRYAYGAIFADLQKFPGAGAWHSSEVGSLFGTFDRSTATPAETGSVSRQKMARIRPRAIREGVRETGHFIGTCNPNYKDGPCDALWDQFLDFTV
ncbi:hypothetical protein B0H19DRAFT_1252444 [Mycena capillaripes]|nr:hypothetical protein B0H19DRAFT_1252444 [Mycena capillaripes]